MQTGSTQRHWPFPRLKKLEGYAYIMTHPGVPTVFWEHLYEDSAELGDGIRKLAAMRKHLGITAGSDVEILGKPEKNQYMAETTGERGRARICMGRKQDMGDWQPDTSQGWEQVLHDKTFSVWQKSSS